MITGLCMHNFKSWKDTGQVRIAPLTGLFGTNSSGKTAILQMLLLLKQTVESNDQSRVLNTGDDKSYVDVGSLYDIVHKKQIPNEIKFSLNWISGYTEKEDRKLLINFAKKFQFNATIDVLEKRVSVKDFTYKSDRNEKLSLVGLEYNSKNKGYSFVAENPDPKKLNPTDPIFSSPIEFSPVKFYGFSDDVSYFYPSPKWLLDLENSFEQELSNLFYLGPLRDYPHRTYLWSGQTPQDVGTKGERAVEALLAAEQSVIEKVAFWLKELKLVHNFSVKPIARGRREHEVLVQSYEGGPKVPITDVGFGVSQLLPVLVLCYYVPEGSTVLLEQPEIHLHPSVQAGLADIFIDVIKNRGLQIILESHSEHLLQRLQRRIAEEQISNEQTALYFCHQNNQGESQITTLELDQYGNIANWPENFFGDSFGDLAAMTEAAVRRRKAAKGK